MKRPAHQAARQAAPPAAVQPTAPQLVSIEKPIYGGAFLARAEGKAIFVPLALPGEQVSVRLIDDKGSYANAEMEEVIKAAPERIAPRCPHFGACGGCHYQHTDYATQLGFKQLVLRETLERAGVQPPSEIAVLASEPWAYRNRIRVAFDTAGNAGYRGRRSHAVVPIHECPIAAPLLVETAMAAAGLVRKFVDSMPPMELALFCNAEETALQATVFTSDPAKFRFDEFARALAEQVLALRGAALALDGRPGKPARIVAQQGATFLLYAAAGFDYRVDQGAFFQANRWLVDALVECVTAGQSGKLAWDLFAGVGLFARKLTSTFERVAAVESAPAAIPALKVNLRDTSSIAIGASTLDFLKRGRGGERPDLIVVDPPRTGLGAEITSLLAQIAAPALVYVSCDPATMARDLRALVAGGYAIERITLADLFPQTFHLETVVHLRRT
jgi:23S rRNA (uracil1939-C5)-methyltransferase